MNRSQLWNRNRSRPIHHIRTLLVDLSPQLQPDLVSRSNHIVRCHRNVVHRRKRRGNTRKEGRAKDRQLLARGHLHQALKLRWPERCRQLFEVLPLLILLRPA